MTLNRPVEARKYEEIRGWNDAAVTPICPWCGEEVTDSPDEDIAPSGETFTSCGSCDEPVVVLAHVTYQVSRNCVRLRRQS